MTQTSEAQRSKLKEKTSCLYKQIINLNLKTKDALEKLEENLNKISAEFLDCTRTSWKAKIDIGKIVEQREAPIIQEKGETPAKGPINLGLE